ncbi:type VI secretion system Vgr family protein [Cupriavidus sp. 30B13]|uniref:type VI secretion system Vgr family protein n=1 Tax=Cupriavidus sp. 30B13 TaxID=3384241 RepID=UPI003B8F48D0
MARQSDLRFTFAVVGGVDFEVIAFDLDEALSETFRLDVQLAHADPGLDFAAILDRPALLTLWRGDEPVRHVHGLVSGFEQGDTGFRRTRYRAVVEPALARLRLSSNWRIFQTLSVPEILRRVLDDHGLAARYEQIVTAGHLPREYCVQAGDTDLYFLERIAREEGFYFAFRHDADSHRLIHSDRLFVQGRIAGGPVLYNPNPGGDQPEPALRRFIYTENVRTARLTQRDYTFTHPQYDQEHAPLGADLEHQKTHYAHYAYPGRYKRDEAGKPFTEARLRGYRRDARLARVEGDDPRLVPGLSFKLTGHPRQDMNRGWRPVRLRHHGVQHTSQAEESAGSEQGTHYSYTAELVPDRTEWRAEPLPRPCIEGPQSATVTGPAGEEIYCDEWGRVKVQFPWDRQGRHDEHSSCWIRVAQNWAGATWGHMAIPRIGQEVIVDFWSGDPDQPVITGRTYRSNQLPPYALPHHKTRMTIKSQTHKGEGYNELRFEDEKDQEEIFVHAQKDQNIHVNHDETTFVGHDRSEQVQHDETVAIGHDRKETVGKDEQVTVGQDRRHDVGRDDFQTVGRNHTIRTGKDRTEEVGNNRRDKTVAHHWVEIGGHAETTVQGHHKLQAGQSIERKTARYELQAGQVARLCGPGGTITIDSSGITLEGTQLRFKGQISMQGGGAGGSLSLSSSPTLGEEPDSDFSLSFSGDA